MSREQATLIEPTDDLADEYVAYCEEFRAAGEKELHGAGPFEKAASGSFAEMLCLARDQAAGRILPDGYVPADTYWFICGGRVIGTCNLRQKPH
ncbi:MAG: hypothetical protein J7M14_04765 [Planctomycetes bacterium]|nr:hypothetical protein [Planctomycetota bacterium]